MITHSNINAGRPANEAGERATTLDPEAGYVTVINTYTVAPQCAEALLDLLVRATTDTLSHMPGFVSANFHVNDEGTQLVNYAQWRDGEAIAAARDDAAVAALIRAAGELADSFKPVLYSLRRSIAGTNA